MRTTIVRIDDVGDHVMPARTWSGERNVLKQTGRNSVPKAHIFKVFFQINKAHRTTKKNRFNVSGSDMHFTDSPCNVIRGYAI